MPIGYQLSDIGYWLLAIDNRLLTIGYWLSTIGYRVLASAEVNPQPPPLPAA